MSKVQRFVSNSNNQYSQFVVKSQSGNNNGKFVPAQEIKMTTPFRNNTKNVTRESVIFKHV